MKNLLKTTALLLALSACAGPKSGSIDLDLETMYADFSEWYLMLNESGYDPLPFTRYALTDIDKDGVDEVLLATADYGDMHCAGLFAMGGEKPVMIGYLDNGHSLGVCPAGAVTSGIGIDRYYYSEMHYRLEKSCFVWEIMVDTPYSRPGYYMDEDEECMYSFRDASAGPDDEYFYNSPIDEETALDWIAPFESTDEIEFDEVVWLPIPGIEGMKTYTFHDFSFQYDADRFEMTDLTEEENSFRFTLRNRKDNAEWITVESYLNPDLDHQDDYPLTAQILENTLKEDVNPYLNREGFELKEGYHPYIDDFFDPSRGQYCCFPGIWEGQPVYSFYGITSRYEGGRVIKMVAESDNEDMWNLQGFKNFFEQFLLYP